MHTAERVHFWGASILFSGRHTNEIKIIKGWQKEKTDGQSNTFNIHREETPFD